jgi:transposase
MVLKYQQQGIPLCGLESIPSPKGPYVKHFYETCTRVEIREENVVWRIKDKKFQTEENIKNIKKMS